MALESQEQMLYPHRLHVVYTAGTLHSMGKSVAERCGINSKIIGADPRRSCTPHAQPCLRNEERESLRLTSVRVKLKHISHFWFASQDVLLR
jgi:hypothetical protein